MIRGTSVEIYYKLKAAGVLTNLRMQVFRCLVFNPSLTGAEVHQIINASRKCWVSTVRARITELYETGFISAGNTRKCSVTDVKALTWDIMPEVPATYDPPQKVRNIKRKREILEALDLAIGRVGEVWPWVIQDELKEIKAKIEAL
jgi:hypothetical protein